MDILLSPPVAFLVYIPLVVLLSILGRTLAGPAKSSPEKSSIYGGGEKAAAGFAAPGYRPFFLIALFFAVLHLGVLVVASSGFNQITGIYLVGLLVALVALILG